MAEDDFGSDHEDLFGDLSGARVRRVTWRVVAFLLVVVLVLVAAAGAVGWQARHTFYVGFADDDVTIFKGRPGGVLWFNPTVEQKTKITRKQVPAARLKEIVDGKDAATIGDARRYVSNLRDQISRQEQSITPTVPTGSAALPNVIGLTETAARARLTTAGFTRVTTVDRPSPTVAVGLVLRTDPADGTTTAYPRRTTIVLALSTGPATTTSTVPTTTTAPTTATTQPGG